MGITGPIDELILCLGEIKVNLLEYCQLISGDSSLNGAGLLEILIEEEDRLLVKEKEESLLKEEYIVSPPDPMRIINSMINRLVSESEA